LRSPPDRVAQPAGARSNSRQWSALGAPASLERIDASVHLVELRLDPDDLILQLEHHFEDFAGRGRVVRDHDDDATDLSMSLPERGAAPEVR